MMRPLLTGHVLLKSFRANRRCRLFSLIHRYRCLELAFALSVLVSSSPARTLAQEPVLCTILEAPVQHGTFSSNTWPAGIVPYEFDANVTSANQNAMVQAMNEWEAVTPVDFRPRAGEANYLHIQSSTGNNSYVGMIGGGQVVNIVNWNFRFIMAHELGHALGLWHEHQRPDRDQYIQINTSNIQPVYLHNFNMVGTAYGPYDFDSVMHYDSCSFSTCCAAGFTCNCNSSCYVITVLPPNQSQQALLGQRTHLSSGDAAVISNLYSPTGRCCTSAGCCSVTTQANCTGNWTVGGTCTPNNPCIQPPSSATASPSTVCPGASVTLTASGGSGGTYKWYSGNCGGMLVGSGSPSVITAPGSNTTYYVRMEGTCGNSGCVSALLTVNLSDSDGDVIPDCSDNCPTVPNVGQSDADLDGTGNACDCAGVAETGALTPGQPVRICNVIVSSTTDLINVTTLKNFFVQDSTGGLAIFGSNAAINALLSQTSEGHLIEISGTMEDYNGMFNLVEPFTQIVDHGFVGIPAPVPTASSDYQDGSSSAEGLQGKLVSLPCVSFQQSGLFVGHTNYTVSPDGGLTLVSIWISTVNLNMVGTPIPCGPVSLRGIFSQFDETPPLNGSYELLLRSLADITACPGSDSDGDGVPDACDNCPTIFNPGQVDCDLNGIGDLCEIGDHDCNNNGIQDECELQGHDCNANGILDECESAANTIVVNSTADPGVPNDCLTTFREALTQANITGGVTVLFHPSIVGGAIRPTSQLPHITGGNININGDIDGNGTPDIEIDGSLAGGAHGLFIPSANNQVRGLCINRFAYNGITLNEALSTNNTVAMCYLGVNLTATLAAPNGFHGVAMWAGASASTIGPGNVLSGNHFTGVAIESGSSTIVLYNRIGTNRLGTSAIPNSEQGVVIRGGANNNTIGPGNLISGNTAQGITVAQPGTNENSIVGNMIGLSINGLSAIPNQNNGIALQQGVRMTHIGGATQELRNVISGNGGAGIFLIDVGTSENAIINNRIGTNANGQAAVPNAMRGIVLGTGSADNIVGPDNLISGNTGDGILVFSDHNNILGNRIGVDVSGVAALPNSSNGIVLQNSGSHHNLVGGADEAANVCSGNNGSGIRISGTGASFNVIEGNRCGTNSAGNGVLPNGTHGVQIAGGATDNVIGPGNILSGNGTAGVQIRDVGTSRNAIRSNWIGSSVSGLLPLGNMFGIKLESGASENVVGGNAANRNIIQFNVLHGVWIDQANTVRNTIRSNSISINGSSGIRLSAGSQGQIQPPAFQAITPTGVSGTASVPNGSIVEVFSDPHSEGANYLGTAIIQGGAFSLNTTIPCDLDITATVTDLVGNTSEFGANGVVAHDCNCNGIRDACENSPECNIIPEWVFGNWSGTWFVEGKYNSTGGLVGAPPYLPENFVVQLHPFDQAYQRYGVILFGALVISGDVRAICIDGNSIRLKIDYSGYSTIPPDPQWWADIVGVRNGDLITGGYDEPVPAPPGFVTFVGPFELHRVTHDCNGNGVLDSQDIGNGTSQDCSANGVPDECEVAPQPIILVSAKLDDSIRSYDPATGALLSTIVPPGAGGLDYPNSHAIASNGDIYVCNAGNDSVLHFSGISGAFIRSFQSPLLRAPSGIILREPNDFLVTNWLDDNVIRCNLQTGQASVFIATGAGGLDGPGPMTRRPNGNVLISGQVSQKVHEYDSNGAFVAIAAQGNGLNWPIGLLLDTSGNLFVSNYQVGQIMRFAANGSFLGVFVAAGSGGLTNAEGLSWLPSGNLLVCNRFGGNVLEYDGVTGEFVRVFTTNTLNEPNYVVMGSIPQECNANGIPDTCEPPMAVNVFVDVLLGNNTSAVDHCMADANRDGMANGMDVQPYVLRLIGG